VLQFLELFGLTRLNLPNPFLKGLTVRDLHFNLPQQHHNLLQRVLLD
jgi:hypothetical protein